MTSDSGSDTKRRILPEDFSGSMATSDGNQIERVASLVLADEWWILEVNEAVASGLPPFFQRCRGPPFKNFELSFCTVLLESVCNKLRSKSHVFFKKSKNYVQMCCQRGLLNIFNV